MKFFIENYQTGRFKPQVILYDNYYNSNIRQTFGVDLAVKSRLDRKVVPIIIQCLLSKLDQIYPDLENDEERVNLWIKPVPLTKVHQLRLKLNELTTPQEINEVLDSNNVAGGVVHPLIITNIFKLYLMELPDSVIPHSVYDLIKSLYTNYPFGSSDQSVNDSRINGIQNVLVDLPKCNVATLDAILTHLNRLVQIIGLKNQKLSTEFKTTLSREFGGLILRPKGGDYSLEGYIHDKHQYNLMNDLFEYKDGIFKELRRRASTRVSSGQQHPQPSSRNGRHDQTDLPSGPKRAATQSKNRLESRLQNAVHKQKDSKNNEVTETSEINQIDASEPSPSTPKKDNSLPTSGSSLRRSVSPNKKKLNSLVEPSNLSPIVSSRPRKKDIIYDTSNSGSLESLGQPKIRSYISQEDFG